MMTRNLGGAASRSQRTGNGFTDPRRKKIVAVVFFGITRSNEFKKNIFNRLFFLKYKQWQCILSYDNSTAMYKSRQKTLNPGGIRTRDLLLWADAMTTIPRTKSNEFAPN
jgi:hypothetical protein